MRLDEDARMGNLRLSSMTGGFGPYWNDPQHARPY